MVSASKCQRNLGIILLITLAGCAHSRARPQTTTEVSTAQTPAPLTEVEQAHQQIAKLQDRVQDLEVRLSALNDKINLESGGASTGTAIDKMPSEEVEVPAAHGKIIPAKKVSGKSHPPTVGVIGGEEDAAPSTESIDRYREAKILYDTKRYSDSVLEFAEFVKNEPDSSLAPAAQYYVGMSYYKQNEFKLAEEELSRGLLSYAHSNYVPDTLLALSQVSGSLKKPTKVAYYKEKLLGSFPNSPQAKKVSENKPGPSSEEVQMPAKPMQSKEEPSVISKPEMPTVTTPTLEGDAE